MDNRRVRVEKLWNEFKSCAESLEQHQFTFYMLVELKMKRLYKDLQENWDDHHADLFIKALEVKFIPMFK